MIKLRCLFFNNKWNFSSSKKYYKYLSANNKDIFVVKDCNKKDLDRVIKSAKVGLSIWESKQRTVRARFIRKVSDLILENQAFLAKNESLDTGKNITQAIEEVKYCAQLWRHASKNLINIKDKTHKINKNTTCKTFYESVGITALIVPWNFPLIVLSERLPYILAAGCSVVIKPSEYATNSILKFIEILQKSDFPKGVINFITGQGNNIGELLVKHKNISMISFTGSSDTGKIIMHNASNDLKRLSLELGGKNPFIVCKDADIERSVGNVITAFTHHSGQCCVSASRLLLQKDIFSKFIKLLKSRLLHISKNFSAISNIKQYKKIFSLILKSKLQKKNIIFGEIPKIISTNKIFLPLVLQKINKDSVIYKHEIFGPVLIVETFTSEKEAIKIANENNYGLAGMVWSKSIKRAENLCSELKIGRLWINGTITQNYPIIPIGGYKWSGIGRETGEEGIRTYSEIKSIIINKK